MKKVISGALNKRGAQLDRYIDVLIDNCVDEDQFSGGMYTAIRHIFGDGGSSKVSVAHPMVVSHYGCGGFSPFATELYITEMVLKEFNIKIDVIWGFDASFFPGFLRSMPEALKTPLNLVKGYLNSCYRTPEEALGAHLTVIRRPNIVGGHLHSFINSMKDSKGHDIGRPIILTLYRQDADVVLGRIQEGSDKDAMNVFLKNNDLPYICEKAYTPSKLSDSWSNDDIFYLLAPRTRMVAQGEASLTDFLTGEHIKVSLSA